jgi:hypothetical protein
MLTALRLLLALLGLSALGIAASILVTGAGATAALAEQAFSAVTGYSGPLSPTWPPTMDSELRFYAALWAAYGTVSLGTALRLAERLDFVPWLAGVFFLGGLGRVLSYVQTGPPHAFFTLLMWIELGLPPLMLALWWGARRGR